MFVYELETHGYINSATLHAITEPVIRGCTRVPALLAERSQFSMICATSASAQV